MIKFEHSIFALPFALTGALLAVRGQGLSSSVLVSKFFWIVVAMVAARSAAMAFNRVVDADIDAYITLAKSPAGRRFSDAMIDAMDSVLSEAAEFMGRDIAELPNNSSL